jgi:hypothetical protein
MTIQFVPLNWLERAAYTPGLQVRSRAIERRQVEERRLIARWEEPDRRLANRESARLAKAA